MWECKKVTYPWTRPAPPVWYIQQLCGPWCIEHCVDVLLLAPHLRWKEVQSLRTWKRLNSERRSNLHFSVRVLFLQFSIHKFYTLNCESYLHLNVDLYSVFTVQSWRAACISCPSHWGRTEEERVQPLTNWNWGWWMGWETILKYYVSTWFWPRCCRLWLQDCGIAFFRIVETYSWTGRASKATHFAKGQAWLPFNDWLQWNQWLAWA